MLNEPQSFDIPAKDQLFGGSAEVFGGKLWYFYRATSKAEPLKTSLWYCTLDMAYAHRGAYANPDGWSEARELVASDGRGGASPCFSLSSPLALADESGLNLFWLNPGDDSDAWVTRLAAETSEPKFEAPVSIAGVRVLKPGSANAGKIYQALSGYTWDNRIVLNWLTEVGGAGWEIRRNLYDVRDISPHAAKPGRFLPPVEIVDAAGNTTRSETQALNEPPIARPDGDPAIEISSTWAVVDGKKQQLVLVSWNQAYKRLEIRVNAIDLETGRVLKPETNYHELKSASLQVLVDPSGVCVGVGPYPDSQSIRILPLTMAARKGAFFPTSAPRNPDSGAQPAPNTWAPIANVFLQGPRRTTNLQQRDGVSTLALAADVDHLIFYVPTGSRTTVRLLAYRYGVSCVTEELASVVDANHKPYFWPKGIIEGPLPIPGENLRPVEFSVSPGFEDRTLPIGSLSYGAASLSSEAVGGHVYASAGLFGSVETAIKFEQEHTFLGIYKLAEEKESVFVKVEASVDVKGDWNWQSETEVEYGNRLTAQTTAVASSRGGPPAGGSVTPHLPAFGVVNGQSAALRIRKRYFIPAGSLEPSRVPEFDAGWSVIPASTVQSLASLNTYSATPGDLTSYTRDRIQAKMAGLYSSLQAHDRAAVERLGSYEDHAQYFDKIVLPNALRIGAGGERWLEFSVSNDAIVSGSCSFSDMRGRGWSVELDSEIKVSAGTSGELLVLGAGAEVKTQAGYRIAVGGGLSGSSREAMSWSLQAEIENFPMAFARGDVKAYTFRIYMLAKSNRWVREAIHFGGFNMLNPHAQLDPKAQCWRIMFSVEPSSIVKL